MPRSASNTVTAPPTTIRTGPADATTPARLPAEAQRAGDALSSGQRYGMAPGMTHSELDAESTAD